VGNPPFIGGTKISTIAGEVYLEWLLALHEEAHGNADMVAHFFRRCFSLLRNTGTLGLIATNTIAQGDTRSTGLHWISGHGGEIFSARRRVRWPRLAAVVVSVVHVCAGPFTGFRRLDGQDVEKITAFLVHRGGNATPIRLAVNANKSFQGTKIYGQGFVFADDDKKGIATPLAEMTRLILKNARNAEVIFPYVGGEEVSGSPLCTSRRHVINFGERDQATCRQTWPDLFAIVEEKVRPEREALADNPDGRKLKQYWWQPGRYRPALYAAVTGLERVLVTTLHSPHLTMRWWPLPTVFSHALAVFPTEANESLCVLQSRPHEVWARFFGSSMKDDLRYTASDCFETFPFPLAQELVPTLSTAGLDYSTFREALMVQRNEGLTQIYNRFHDPDERDAGILKLRDLHAAMDRTVLDAYGWGDIKTDCGFFLDYEIDEEEWGDKKKPYRYRWPDEVREEVLARLLELNAERAKAEARSGVAIAQSEAAGGKAKKPTKKGAKAKKDTDTGDLFS